MGTELYFVGIVGTGLMAILIQNLNTFLPLWLTFLSRLSLLGVTFGGLEMQLSGPKTDFGAQGAP